MVRKYSSDELKKFRDFTSTTFKEGPSKSAITDLVGGFISVQNKLSEADEKQFTAVLGEYISAGLNVQKKLSEAADEGGKNSMADLNNVGDELKQGGTPIYELEGTPQNEALDGVIPPRVAHHLLLNRGFKKTASTFKYMASKDFDPSDEEMKKATISAYIDGKAAATLKRIGGKWSKEDFHNTVAIMNYLMDNDSQHIMVKESMLRCDKGNVSILKTAGWFDDTLGTIGDAFSYVADTTVDVVSWTYDKTVEYGGRMIEDIKEHGLDFIKGIGSALWEWASSNPIVLAVIGAATWFMKNVILKCLPFFGMIYSAIMAFKNIYYAWKSIKKIMSGPAQEFGLDTSIGLDGDFFNPMKALDMPNTLNGILEEITRDVSDIEYSLADSKENYIENRTGDPEKLASFVELTKLTKVWVTEMLGLPFNLVLGFLDYLALGMKWGGAAAGPAAPLVVFLGFLLEAAVNVALTFAEHYVVNDKKKQFDEVLARVTDITLENIQRNEEIEGSADDQLWNDLKLLIGQLEEMKVPEGDSDAQTIYNQKKRQIELLMKDLQRDSGEASLTEMSAV
tara:strand:- start:1595 stop:3292 length:1698 start_codon:yes stop_codon:yes gene_type:complete